MRVRVRVRVLTVRDEKKSMRSRGVMGLIFFCVRYYVFVKGKGEVRLVLASLLGYNVKM